MPNIDKSEGSGPARYLHSIAYATEQVGSTLTQIAENALYQKKHAIYATEVSKDYNSDISQEKNDEARHNLATHIMSNGVEVIIASDKNKVADSNTGLQKSSLKRIFPSQAIKPMTLAPSTLKNQMILVMPSNTQEMFTIPFNSNHFITKTCLTTYTYRTTYLRDGIATVESREKVISNIATEERNYLKMDPKLSSGVTLSHTPVLAIGIYPTTYTFYNTVFDGKVPVISKNEHTITNTITGPDDYIMFLQSSEAVTPLYDTNTYYSEIIITNTVTDSGIQKLITTSNTLTQVVVTESLPTLSISVFESTSAINSRNLYLLQSVLNTASQIIASATDVVTSKKDTNSDLAIFPSITVTDVNTKLISGESFGYSKRESVTHPHANDDVYIYATKTFLTTFTYFTSTLVGNKQTEEKIKSEITSCNSNTPSENNLTYHTRVIENVITETIPSSLLKPDLIAKIRSDLKKKKNQRRIIVTIATLLGGQALEITATKMISPTIDYLPQFVSNNPVKNERNKATFIRNNTFNATDETNIGEQMHSAFKKEPLLTNMNFKVDIDSTATLKIPPPSSILDSDEFVVEESEQQFHIVPAPPAPLETEIVTSASTLIKESTTAIRNNSKVISVKSTEDKLKTEHTVGITEKPTKLNQPISSFNLNRLTAFRPVFTAMADLIQSKFVSAGISNEYLKPQKEYHNTADSKRLQQNITANSMIDLPSSGPIYIPVQNTVDEKWYQKLHNSYNFHGSNNNKNITELSPQGFHLQPQKAVTSLDNTKIVMLKNNSPKHSHEEDYITPLINGGIPIRPGDVITANSDVIVGKPNGIQHPHLPYTNRYMDLNNVPTNGVSFYKYVLQHPLRNKFSTSSQQSGEHHISLTESQQIERENFDEILTPPPLVAKDFYKLNLSYIKPISSISDSFKMKPPMLPIQNSALVSNLHPKLSDVPQRKHIYLPVQSQLTSPTNQQRVTLDKDTIQILNRNISLKQNELFDIKRIPEIYSTDLPPIPIFKQNTLYVPPTASKSQLSIDESHVTQNRLKPFNEKVYKIDTTNLQLEHSYYPHYNDNDHSSNNDKLKYNHQPNTVATNHIYSMSFVNDQTQKLEDQTRPLYSKAPSAYYNRNQINSGINVSNHNPMIENTLQYDTSSSHVQHSYSPLIESISEVNSYGTNNQQNILQTNNMFSSSLSSKQTRKSEDQTQSYYAKLPTTYYTQQKMNMNALSHNVNINVPPITFKNDSDYPPSVPIRGQIHNDEIANYDHIRLGNMPHIMIPKTEEKVEVNLTPQNSIGSIHVTPFLVHHKTKMNLKNSTRGMPPVIGSFAVLDDSYLKNDLMQNKQQIHHIVIPSLVNAEITSPVFSINDFNRFLRPANTRHEPTKLNLKSILWNSNDNNHRIVEHISSAPGKQNVENFVTYKSFDEFSRQNILKEPSNVVLTISTASMKINSKELHIKPSNLNNEMSVTFTIGENTHNGNVIHTQTQFDKNYDTEDFDMHLASRHRSAAVSNNNWNFPHNHIHSNKQVEHFSLNSESSIQDHNKQYNYIQRPIFASFELTGMHDISTPTPFTKLRKVTSTDAKQTIYLPLELSDGLPFKPTASAIKKNPTKMSHSQNQIFVASGHEFQIQSVNNTFTHGDTATQKHRVNKLRNSTKIMHILNGSNSITNTPSHKMEDAHIFAFGSSKRKINSIELTTKSNGNEPNEVSTDIQPPPPPSLRPIGLSQLNSKNVFGLSPPPLPSSPFVQPIKDVSDQSNETPPLYSTESYNKIGLKHFPLIPLSKISVTGLSQPQNLTHWIVSPSFIKKENVLKNYESTIQEADLLQLKQNIHHATPALTIKVPTLSIINNTPGWITESKSTSHIVPNGEKSNINILNSFSDEKNQQSSSNIVRFAVTTNERWVPEEVSKQSRFNVHFSDKSEKHLLSDDYGPKIIHGMSLHPSENNLLHFSKIKSPTTNENQVFHLSKTPEVSTINGSSNTKYSEQHRVFNSMLSVTTLQQTDQTSNYIKDAHLFTISKPKAVVTEKGEQLHTNILKITKTHNLAQGDISIEKNPVLHPTVMTKLNHFTDQFATKTTTDIPIMISKSNIIEMMTDLSNITDTLVINTTNQYLFNHKPYHTQDRKTEEVYTFEKNIVSYRTDNHPSKQLENVLNNNNDVSKTRILENAMHDENSNSIFIIMTNEKSPSNDSFNNVNPGDSKYVPDGSDNVDIDYDSNLSIGVAVRDEETQPNDLNQANHVLLGGLLMATQPKPSETTIPESDIESTVHIRKQVNMGGSCKPECKSSRNEVCTHNELQMGCICRPGFARMFPDRPCKPTYTYEMQIQTYRIGSNKLIYDDQLTNNESENFRKLAQVVHNAVDRMVMQSDFRDVYHGVHLTSFEREENLNKHILANFLLQLSDNSDGKRLENVFKKYLRISNLSIGNTALFTSRNGVEAMKIVDFDECTHNKFHDCSKNARCFNLEGTYTCSCHEGYIDLSENTLYPGRACSAAMIGCELCNYHGKCMEKLGARKSKERNVESDVLTCKCFTWYTGDFCQLNLKILLIALLAIGTILFMLLFICILMACLKRPKISKAHRLTTQFAAIQKGIASKNLSTVLSGKNKMHGKNSPHDKCAILRDSSSEASQNSLPYVLQAEFNGNISKPFAESNNKLNMSYRLHKSDRSITVMIPRAKYYPTLLSQGQLTHQHTIERVGKHYSDLTIQEADSSTTTIKMNINPQQNEFKKTSSVSSKKIVTESTSFGALVSAGFEVSALVGENSQYTSSGETTGLDKTSTTNVCNLKTPIKTDIFTSTESYASKLEEDFNLQNNVSPLNYQQVDYNTYNSDNDLISTMDLWLDNIKQNKLSAEARSYEEATLQAQTKANQHSYDGHTSHTNDEGNTMAEREIGSTFLLPHTHLYKPERNDSDMSGFESI